MVKENGMVMMSETEYREMKNKIWEAENKLDQARMELHTYRKSMRELAVRNIEKKGGDIDNIEIPAEDLANIMETIMNDRFEDDDFRYLLDQTDITIMWNGLKASFWWGAHLFNNGFFDAIRETYEDMNS